MEMESNSSHYRKPHDRVNNIIGQVNCPQSYHMNTYVSTVDSLFNGETCILKGQKPS